MNRNQTIVFRKYRTAVLRDAHPACALADPAQQNATGDIIDVYAAEEMYGQALFVRPKGDGAYGKERLVSELKTPVHALAFHVQEMHCVV